MFEARNGGAHSMCEPLDKHVCQRPKATMWNRDLEKYMKYFGLLKISIKVSKIILGILEKPVHF